MKPLPLPPINSAAHVNEGVSYLPLGRRSEDFKIHEVDGWLGREDVVGTREEDEVGVPLGIKCRQHMRHKGEIPLLGGGHQAGDGKDKGQTQYIRDVQPARTSTHVRAGRGGKEARDKGRGKIIDKEEETCHNPPHGATLVA